MDGAVAGTERDLMGLWPMTATRTGAAGESIGAPASPMRAEVACFRGVKHGIDASLLNFGLLTLTNL